MSSDEWQEAKENMKRKVTVPALFVMLFALCAPAKGAATEESLPLQVKLPKPPEQEEKSWP
ncbi:MAG TPA: hypothetical protein VEG60_20800 [Candidatus Binatia bacterium]|nr:hypothetical protein [Candidatus Binatia bacterium]